MHRRALISFMVSFVAAGALGWHAIAFANGTLSYEVMVAPQTCKPTALPTDIYAGNGRLSNTGTGAAKVDCSWPLDENFEYPEPLGSFWIEVFFNTHNGTSGPSAVACAQTLNASSTNCTTVATSGNTGYDAVEFNTSALWDSTHNYASATRVTGYVEVTLQAGDALLGYNTLH